MSLQSGWVGFRDEFAGGGWKAVIGAFLGSSVGVTSIPFYTIGMFAGPLQEAFGWSRGQILASIAFSMLGTMLAAVPTGWLIDRFGVRKVALAGLACLAVALVCFGLAGPSLILWYVSWTAMAFFGGGTTAITWTRGIADWFDRGRGFALGLALTGNGITAIVAPPLVTAVIQSHGWRTAYFVLAATVVVVGMLPTWLWFHAKGSTTGKRAKPETADAAKLPGLSFAEGMRSYRLWLLTLIFVTVSFGLAGSIPSLVPLMVDKGYTPLAAAGFASFIGMSVIVGRLGTGLLLDRFWGPAVGAVLLIPPTIAALILATPAPDAVLIAVAVSCIGLTAGMEFDLMGYLCARYFGLRNYGKLFAWPWVGFAIGAATGATAFGWVRDVTGSYTPVLLLAAATFGVSGLLLLLLGRYPSFDQAPNRELVQGSAA